MGRFPDYSCIFALAAFVIPFTGRRGALADDGAINATAPEGQP
jgi:hypothetical protein